MKHSRLFAGLAATGGFFAMSAAHAIVPAVAAGIAALGGAAVGSAAASHPPAVAVVPPPAVAVVPDNTVVMGGPPATVEEVIPAPREGYQWERGHYELNGGVSAWVPGHWVANTVVIYPNH